MGAAARVHRQPGACPPRSSSCGGGGDDRGRSSPTPSGQWDPIKAVVHRLGGLDADQIVLESTRRDGTKHDVTLRAKIAVTASLYLTRDKAMRSLPTQLAFRRHLNRLREDATRLRKGIVRSPAFWFAHNDYAPDTDMLAATDAYFAKLYRNLRGIIAAMGPERKKTGSAARKNISRDLFWSELLAIRCQIGGKPPHGVDAAVFLINVSDPVFKRGAQDAVPEPLSVIQWLRRRSREE